MAILHLVLIGLAFSGGIGFLIGSVKGNGKAGIIWSVLLGPLGWLIVLCQSDHRPACPLCGASLEKATFKRCRHCGGEIGRPRISTVSTGKTDPMEVWEAKERAKTVLQVPDHLRGKKLEE